MNYEYYKIFYYVGKHKNITRAATELYSSQPAVSRAIRNLEEELGCVLFQRSKHGVEFTHEGQILFNYVSSGCSQFMRGEEEINKAIDPESGTIHIGTTITSMYGFLFEVIRLFRRSHPKTRFIISTGSSNKTMEKVRNGLVDIAFVTTPFIPSRSLVQSRVLDFSDILICGNGEPYKKLLDRTVRLDELSDYPFVCLEEGMQFRQHIDDFFEENELRFSPEIELDSADQIVPFVKKNYGLAFVPEDIAKEAIDLGEVRKITPEKTPAPRSVYMVTNPTHPVTGASREFSRIIQRKILPVEKNTDNREKN